ncbi:hypothetical protein COLO4_32771 [Corchorus olitorius]|uniref:Uncharacterized protein n=1 Tax=Corchorus olitorius TaxID=93759 RepID=A0A1R3GYD3_9ROSI|nr:hypothetical protein COLO4_32771 [Corchorus olitorius]
MTRPVDPGDPVTWDSGPGGLNRPRAGPGEEGFRRGEKKKSDERERKVNAITYVNQHHLQPELQPTKPLAIVTPPFPILNRKGLETSPDIKD